MMPEYPEMNDVLLRIKVLCEERGWSMYRLSKESGIMDVYRKLSTNKKELLSAYLYGLAELPVPGSKE